MTRWIAAFSPAPNEDEDEALYDERDGQCCTLSLNLPNFSNSSTGCPLNDESGSNLPL